MKELTVKGLYKLDETIAKDIFDQLMPEKNQISKKREELAMRNIRKYPRVRLL